VKKRVVVVGVAVLMLGSIAGGGAFWWHDRQNEVSQPSTARSLAAAAERHLPDTAKQVRVLDNTADSSAPMVMLDFEIGGRSTRLMIEARERSDWLADAVSCRKPDPSMSCERLKDSGGASVSRVKSSKSRSIAIVRPGDIVIVSELPDAGLIGDDVLTAIATDPLVGTRTSRKMLTAGTHIQLSTLH
jgi:hypothetical protein